MRKGRLLRGLAIASILGALLVSVNAAPPQRALATGTCANSTATDRQCSSSMAAVGKRLNVVVPNSHVH